MIIEKGTSLPDEFLEEVTSLKEEMNNEASLNNIANEETSEVPLLDNKWQKLEFEDCLEFLMLFDDNINSGAMTLHPWQAEELMRLSKSKGTSKHPFKYCLCAANGSGKDAFIVAPWALFFICCKIRSLVVITSASGTQLTSQTESYIASLANNINQHAIGIFGQPILKVRQRHITCLLSGSEIRLFATDEEGKAEGFHPKDFNSEMCIIVNEAKNVAPEIFRALRRCTGFSHWMLISTPGQPQGDFYESWDNVQNKVGSWHGRRVTYYDCPHQSPDEFEEDKKRLGEYNPWFRSKWLAEFAYIDGKYVINQERLNKLRKLVAFEKVRWIFKDEIRVGIDIALSTAGDESVISIWHGNKHMKQITYRIKDALLLGDAIDDDLKRNLPKHKEIKIFLDDCGVGRALISILRDKGWEIIPVRFNSQAKNPKQFRNRGAELYFKFARLCEEGCLIPIDDDELYKQLQSRKFKETESGIDKLQLESKAVMISNGLKSPDRGDAAVIAFTDANLDKYLDAAMEQESVPERVIKTPQQIAYELEERMYDAEFALPKRTNKRFNSLKALVRAKVNNHLGRWQ